MAFMAMTLKISSGRNHGRNQEDIILISVMVNSIEDDSRLEHKQKARRIQSRDHPAEQKMLENHTSGDDIQVEPKSD